MDLHGKKQHCPFSVQEEIDNYSSYFRAIVKSGFIDPVKWVLVNIQNTILLVLQGNYIDDSVYVQYVIMSSSRHINK